MKKITFFLFLASILLFSSCSNNDDFENTESSQVQKHNKRDRVSFSSIEEMAGTISALSSMSKSEIKHWSNSKLEKSYFSSPYILDTTLVYHHNSFKAILNDDLEFCINDSILWYNNDNIYFLSTTDNSEGIKEMKRNPDILTVWGENNITNASSSNSRAISGPQDSGISTTFATFTITPPQSRNGLNFSPKELPELNSSVPLHTLNVKCELMSRWPEGRTYFEYKAGYQSEELVIILTATAEQIVNGKVVRTTLKDPSFVTNVGFQYFLNYTVIYGKYNSMEFDAPRDKITKMDLFAERQIEGNRILIHSCGNPNKIQTIHDIYLHVQSGELQMTIGELPIVGLLTKSNFSI